MRLERLAELLVARVCGDLSAACGELCHEPRLELAARDRMTLSRFAHVAALL
jgi:hypothetical protein